jgi:hypothetical protein
MDQLARCGMAEFMLDELWVSSMGGRRQAMKLVITSLRKRWPSPVVCRRCGSWRNQPRWYPLASAAAMQAGSRPVRYANSADGTPSTRRNALRMYSNGNSAGLTAVSPPMRAAPWALAM